MTHGLPDRFGLIGPVDSVAVAELETARSQHSHVPAGGGAVRRNDDVPIHDDLLSFDAPTQRHGIAIVVTLHDFAILSGEDSITSRNLLTLIEVHDSQSLLVRLLDVVPVGWNPRRILILALHGEPATRRFEAPLSGRSAHQLLAAAGRHRRLEQDVLSLLVPEPMVGHAHNYVRLLRRLTRGLVEKRLEAVARHAKLRLHLVEDTEVVVVDHAVDVAQVAELRRFREQRDAEDRRDDEAADQRPDRLASVRKDSARSHLLPHLPRWLAHASLSRSIPSYRH